MKQISLKIIVEIQRLTIEKFEAEDEDYPDYRIVKAKERAIWNRLSKITTNENLQCKILDIIEKGNWDTKDLTYKSMCDKIRELGFKIV